MIEGGSGLKVTDRHMSGNEGREIRCYKAMPAFDGQEEFMLDIGVCWT